MHYKNRISERQKKKEKKQMIEDYPGSHQQTDIVSWCRNDGKESMEKDNRRIHEGKRRRK